LLERTDFKILSFLLPELEKLLNHLPPKVLRKVDA